MTTKPKTLLLGLLTPLLLVALGCTVQEIALIQTSIVRGTIGVPPGMRAVQIRVNRVGTTTERTPVSAETAFTDVQGDFLLETNRIGGGYVVARGIDYDIAFAPVFFEEYGETLSVEQWQPQTGPMLAAKTPGSSLFLLFEEDFEPDFGPIDRVDLVGPASFSLDETALPLHDDGSLVDIDPVTPGMQVSGDVAAGDKIWTLRVTGDRFPAGTQRYGFFINENLDLGLQRDPYEESSVSGRSAILVK